MCYRQRVIANRLARQQALCNRKKSEEVHVANVYGVPSRTLSLAPFTLRSIFGTARIKLVPVPLFWFLDYLFR